MKVKTLCMVCGLVVLSACASPPRRTPDDGEETSRGTGYLEDGPTVEIDAAPPRRTTLEVLDKKTRENARLRKELDAARSSLQEAERRKREAEATARDLAGKVEELEKLLAEQAEENRQLTDELLRTRIARLRVERRMLETRIAELAGGGK